MSVTSTAKRRRRQHAIGFTHLAKQQRPKYAKRDEATSKKRLQKLLETERRIRQGKNK